MRHFAKLLVFLSVALGIAGLTYSFLYVGRRWAVPPYFALLACIVVSSVSLGLMIGLYLRYALACQRDRHKSRWENYASTKTVRSMSEEHKGVMLGYIVRNMDKSDRKRLIFQTILGTLSVATGLLSIIATVIDAPLIHKTASAIAAISTLILTTFSVAEFTMIHRRAGYLIESAINQWLAGADGYTNDATTNFNNLLAAVRVIIDTGETSFIGAGMPSGQVEIEEPIPVAQDDWFNHTDVGTSISLDNFPAWQTAALENTPDGFDPVTQ